MEFAAMIWGGFFLDLIIGDPESWWHPVRAIGSLICKLEKLLRRLFPKTSGGELLAGGILAVFTSGLTCTAAAAVLWAGKTVHPALGFLLGMVMCWQLLAARSLKTESRKVYRALKKQTLEEARYQVSRIVGRDTQNLTEDGVIRAAVETVAENASDGVVAPLFWMFLFGPAGGFFYKAVNTMDSMVGYKNERYLYFGRAAARLDDLVNWIPARLTGLLFILSAFLLPGFDGKGAFRIWRRDRRCHKSPNSAQSEAACAGALGVELAGDASYFGKIVKKPTIGDPLRPVEPEDIIRADRLMYAASVLALAAGTAASAWLSRLTG